MLRKIALGGAILGTSVALNVAEAQVPAEPANRPNIVVIVTDDQRVETMSAMPATRRLFRAGGTKFTNAFATTPLCCPARASIMSGRYAHNHGITTQEEGDAFKLEQSKTMQSELKAAGYRTGIYGKYLNGWDLTSSPTYFDDWAIFSHTEPNGYFGGSWNENGSVHTVNRYATNFIRSRALSFVREAESSDEQPWYLYVAPPAPHAPFDPGDRYFDAPVTLWDGNPAVEETDRTDKPSWVTRRSEGLSKGRWLRRAQLRTLMSVDDMIGRLFAELDELGEDKTTLAFFLSDNGFMWGEHGLTQKRFPYGPSVRVPFFTRWPAMIGPGTADDRIAANIDIAPTVYDAAGIAPGYEPDGHSLLGSNERDRLLLEFWDTGRGALPTWASTITEGFQYVEYYGDQGLPETPTEYYDLTVDPWQLDNLLGDSDAANDPNVPMLSVQLSFDRSCEGSECP
ncbi:MAG: sulfatase family protein [Actinomycetota bacterium]